MSTPAKLTTKQAATRTGLSQSLLYQLCKERRLPHFRIGGRGRRGRLLIDEADLLAFMNAHRIDSSVVRQDGLKHIKT